jgi:hypothetical protein
LLLVGDALNHLGRDAEGAHDVVVQDDGAAAGDGAHGQFLVAGHAELANEVHVQRCAEGGGHLVRDRHTSPWQGENHRVVTPPVALQQTGDDPARLPPIPEPHL